MAPQGGTAVTPLRQTTVTEAERGAAWSRQHSRARPGRMQAPRENAPLRGHGPDATPVRGGSWAALAARGLRPAAPATSLSRQQLAGAQEGRPGPRAAPSVSCSLLPDCTPISFRNWLDSALGWQPLGPRRVYRSGAPPPESRCGQRHSWSVCTPALAARSARTSPGVRPGTGAPATAEPRGPLRPTAAGRSAARHLGRQGGPGPLTVVSSSWSTWS